MDTSINLHCILKIPHYTLYIFLVLSLTWQFFWCWKLPLLSLRGESVLNVFSFYSLCYIPDTNMHSVCCLYEMFRHSHFCSKCMVINHGVWWIVSALILILLVTEWSKGTVMPSYKLLWLPFLGFQNHLPNFTYIHTYIHTYILLFSIHCMTFCCRN